VVVFESLDFKKKIEYENMFYLSCDSSRIGKAISQYMLFRQTIEVSGDIIECGGFKGASFSRFSMYRKLHGLEDKRLIGFDTFGGFPETDFSEDFDLRNKFISEGGRGISVDQLWKVLEEKKCRKNVELVEGNICKTVPEFIKKNPGLRISFLNLDVDIYEPSVTILEYLYPRISRGGVLMLDDYNTFPGETKAANDFFKDKDVTILQNDLANSPYYVIKN
jgi:hypothetical protein